MYCGREACSHWRTRPWRAGHDFTKRRLVPWVFRSEWPWPRRIWTWAGAVRTCSPRRRRWRLPDGNHRRAQDWQEEAQRSWIWALVQNQQGDWKGKRRRVLLLTADAYPKWLNVPYSQSLANFHWIKRFTKCNTTLSLKPCPLKSCQSTWVWFTSSFYTVYTALLSQRDSGDFSGLTSCVRKRKPLTVSQIRVH